MMNDNLYDSRAWRMLVARYGEREAHAIVYYVMEVAWLYVKLNQTDMAQEYLDEVKMLLDHQPVASSRLYSIFYRVSIELYRVRPPSTLESRR